MKNEKEQSVKGLPEEKKAFTLHLPESELEVYAQEATRYGYSLNAHLLTLIRKGHRG